MYFPTRGLMSSKMSWQHLRNIVKVNEVRRMEGERRTNRMSEDRKSNREEPIVWSESECVELGREDK